MSRPRRLQWGPPSPSLPSHPYRDTLIVYGVLAGVIVLVAWVSGSDVVRAVLVAAAAWVFACVWSCYRWYVRIRDAARASESELR